MAPPDRERIPRKRFGNAYPEGRWKLCRTSILQECAQNRKLCRKGYKISRIKIEQLFHGLPAGKQEKSRPFEDWLTVAGRTGGLCRRDLRRKP